MIYNTLEAILDGQCLTAIHPNIFLEEINCSPADRSFSTVTAAGREGERIIGSQRKQTTVSIRIRVLEKDPIQRQSILQEIMRWAGGTSLQISGRPEQQLRVICTKMPSTVAVREWAKEIDLEFKAYDLPFWTEKVLSRVILTGSSGSGELYVPGNGGKTLVEARVIPTGSLTSVTLTVGNTEISLAGLSATAQNPVSLTYNERQILSIRQGTTSILDKRSAGSSDDLLATCGVYNAVSFTASGGAEVMLSARGRWL